MKITGQILKENRERKGISISEVALSTKINSRMIQAMEEGDVSQLPPKTFLRGFVRSYASFLELDVESILSTFFEEMGTTKPKVAVTEPSLGTEAPQRERQVPSDANDTLNPRASLGVKIGAVAGILLLVVLIVFFKKKMDSYQSETVIVPPPSEIESLQKDGEPVPPDDDVAADVSPTPSDMSGTPSPTPADGQVAAAVPVSSPTPVVTATATPVPTPVHTPTSTPKPTPTPVATASPPPAPKPTPTPSPTPVATASPTPAASPSPKPSPAARPQEVILEALNTVTVEAQIDGEPAKTFQLKSEQVQTFKARRKVVLKFSDGGAINMIVNGVDRGVPGDLGKPSRVEIP